MLLSSVILLLGILPFSAQLSVREYLTLNKEQKLKLDQFRILVSDRVPHSYMKKDAYLIRWLRDQDFDLPAAEERLMANIAWREDNKMDTILDEDWSDFDSEYRLNVEGCDKDGKPVLSVIVGDWDVRRGILTGKFERMSRYFDKLLEEADELVRRMQDDGQIVTQASVLYDMGNFNLITQACGRCIPIFFRILTNVQEHFPGFYDKIVAVNVPEIALPIYELFKPQMSQKYRDSLSIYGRNKEVWSKLLGKEIDPDQLSRVFGGTNEEALDYRDLMKSLNGTVPSCRLFKKGLQVEGKE